MTLLQLHHNDLHGGPVIARAFRRLRTALRLMHRAIVAAKTHRVQNELMFHARDHDESSLGKDATRYPQRPMILGDKWDF